MARKIADLGEIGVAGLGILRPIDLVLYRGGAVWNLTGYTDPTLEVWDFLTKVPVAITGALTVEDAVAGIVRYTPAVGDPIFDTSGHYEARAHAIPGGSGDPEASGVFRFSIGIRGTATA